MKPIDFYIILGLLLLAIIVVALIAFVPWRKMALGKWGNDWRKGEVWIKDSKTGEWLNEFSDFSFSGEKAKTYRRFTTANGKRIQVDDIVPDCIGTDYDPLNGRRMYCSDPNNVICTKLNNGRKPEKSSIKHWLVGDKEHPAVYTNETVYEFNQSVESENYPPILVSQHVLDRTAKLLNESVQVDSVMTWKLLLFIVGGLILIMGVLYATGVFKSKPVKNLNTTTTSIVTTSTPTVTIIGGN